MSKLKAVIDFLKNYDGEPITIMEVCGTHTASICENGIRDLLSPKIRLISGPGCPVCVTVTDYVDRLCELSMQKNICVVTFGDMIKVKGSKKSLRDMTAIGGNVKMVYSPFEIINLALADTNTTFVFASVGFETTTPAYALLLEEIIDRGITNIGFLTALKTMPHALDVLMSDGIEADGFIAPGHVCSITGWDIFSPLAKKYSVPFVVSGFEGEDIIYAIYALVKLKGVGVVKNLYTAVNKEGNKKAEELVNKYFKASHAYWRGMGKIENSGMVLREEYSKYDFGSIDLKNDMGHKSGCKCGLVVCGKISPTQCPLFKKVCCPENPQGACMVSAEGSCFNYYVNNS